MPPSDLNAPEYLRHLTRLWQREKLATRQKAEALRDAIPLATRVRRGLAFRGLHYEATEGAGAGRCALWFSVESGSAPEHSKVSNGDPVVLFCEAHAERQRGVVGRRLAGRLSVIVDSDYAGFVEKGPVCLDLEAPEATFERGALALERFAKDQDFAHQRALFFGTAEPTFRPSPTVEFRDAGLNASQQGAVRLALSANSVALIHGPPGTGKTRTLVEVVRQHLLLGQSVLVSAASNTAVDHLTRQLAAQGVRPLRLGHPARVAEDLWASTIEARLAKNTDYQLAKEWQTTARRLRDKYGTGRERGSRLGPRKGRDELKRADRLSGDARRLMGAARAQVIRQSRVVCTTAAGADASVLGTLRFDVVVLDEATQAPDPIALAALMRADRCVLAGDPQQLSPTVVDPQAAAEGLGSTLFERAARRWNAQATHLLEVQYRMHETLMRFPSKTMYGGRLVADPTVATRELTDLPNVEVDPLRTLPWTLVDTAGSGWQEEQDEETLSTFNRGHAARAELETRRLLRRGLSPQDLAVITPYGAQVRLLRSLLPDAVAQGLEIGTVDGFQGREKEAIVLDLVRSNGEQFVGFLADIRRTNVALTRAKRYLVVIADGSTLGSHDYYGELLAAAERDGAWESSFAQGASS